MNMLACLILGPQAHDATDRFPVVEAKLGEFWRSKREIPRCLDCLEGKYQCVMVF